MLMWWLLLLYAYGGNAIAQPTYWSSSCSYSNDYGEPSNFTNGPLYQGNLTALLSSLTSHSANGFYNDYSDFTYDNDYYLKIYGLSFCWGYVSASRCQSCVATASQQILRNCPNHDYAEIANDVCMLRYWNNWFSLQELDLTIFTDSQSNTSESLDPNECRYVDEYMRVLMLDVKKSSVMFRAREFQISASVKRYGSVQCSHVEGCDDCLMNLIDQFNGICRKWRRAWWITSFPLIDDRSNFSTVCAMRYGDLPFYILDGSPPAPPDGSPPAPPDGSPPAPPPGERGGVANSNMSRTVIISIILSVIIVISLVCCCINYLWCINRRRKDHGPEGENRSIIFQDHVQNEDVLNVDVPTIPLSTILHCTGQFSDEFKLGEGGFGPVYKGILPDGRPIAVKMLSENSSQGLEEFKNEVTFIAKLQHKNLVRLLSYCTEENKKLVVYEYMPNASLDLHLFDKAKRHRLDWNIRLNIINGIARGILYLHEDSRLRVIHRDLKAGNVLLDQNMNPKISDFGLARIFKGYQRQANTQRIIGTYGYMAPEYAMEGLFSVKSDVFSFGVLLLEIISGKRNSDQYYLLEHGESLLAYAWRLWGEGKSLMLMDSLLEKNCTPSEVMKCIHIALLCVQEDAADRPTMSMVVVMLGSDEIILPTPTQPPFSASNNSKSCSINNVTISNVAPR